MDKREIFSNADEYQRFLAYLCVLNDAAAPRLTHEIRRDYVLEAKPLKLTQGAPLVAIGAYCLMPNHFHLYVTPLVENGISKFMQRLQTAYTMYFNERHARSGALFQGTFKARHVLDDRYARYLFSYIHLNPAKLVDPHWKEFGSRDFKKVREYVQTYPYSSFGEYNRKRHVITDPARFPEYFSTRRSLDAHIDDWLEEGDMHDAPVRGLASNAREE
ncbi:MAG TPA: transposase [Candidatus Paceibacterota bacterium]|nr:transposase [Candidatus Paceibacterota bacterium]